MNPRTLTAARALIAVIAASACFGAARDPSAGDSTPSGAQHSFVVAGDHKHVYVSVQSGKKWVPPKTAKKVVGYDDKGKPIYKDVVVAPGYYKIEYVEKCNICGKVKG